MDTQKFEEDCKAIVCSTSGDQFNPCNPSNTYTPPRSHCNDSAKCNKRSCILMACKTNYLIKLPEELLIEIFLRFSVKSLICAKRVCKQWYALITNPDFELNHIQYQKTHNKGRLLLQYLKEDTKRYSYALFSDETLVSDTYHDLDNFQPGFIGLQMEGPINGLYCLFTYKDRIILWNPALSEFKTLPLPHPNVLPHLEVEKRKIGFGIDPLTRDYKLLFVRHFSDKSIYVTISNLSKNTWRLLDLGEFRICDRHRFIHRDNCFLNGIYYWWDRCGMVVAFDMSKENFREISGPDFYDQKSFPGDLTLYDDKVALLLINDACLEVVVMLEGGVWIKQFKFARTPQPYIAVGLWKNDVVLLTRGYDPTDVHNNSQMVLLNTKTRKLRNMGPRGTRSCFRASVYYESLVSVSCGTKHKGKRASLNTQSEFLNSCYNP